jgi:raffinose/stachyose/melibiose transport system substrate-binding protein
MRELIIASVTSGSGPDIFYFELGAGQVQPLIDADLIIPLDDVANELGWRDKFSSFALFEATHQGKLWGVPNELEYIGMFYNKKIFKELGVDVPKSWDELVEIATKAEAAGYVPFAFGDMEKWPGFHRIGIGYQWNPEGKALVEKAIFDDTVDLNDPRFVEGFEKLMLLDRQYWANATEQSHDEAIASFVNGNIAMYHMGTWLVNDIQKAGGTADDFGVFIAPVPGTATPSTIAGAGGGWYINSSCEYIDEAIDFLEVAVSDEAMEAWAKKGYVPPVNLDIESIDGVPDITKAVIQTMNENMDDMGYFIHHFVSPEQSSWTTDGYQGLLLGTISPKQFVDRFYELGVEAKAKGFRP